MMAIDEVAAEFRVKPTTIREWCRKRKIVATRIGRRWLFDEGYIKDLKSKHKNADFAAEVRRRTARVKG